MDDNILAQNLAYNLVDLRRKRNLTQAALAKLVGLPRSTIANLESGLGNPSLQNLSRMSQALQTPIDQLLMAQRAMCTLVLAKDVPVQERSQGLVRVHKLLTDPIPSMAIEKLEIKGGAVMKGIPHAQGTKEYLYCVQGELMVSVTSDQFHLKQGDVLAFPGDVRHSYSNPLKPTAIALSVVVLSPVH